MDKEGKLPVTAKDEDGKPLFGHDKDGKPVYAYDEMGKPVSEPTSEPFIGKVPANLFDKNDELICWTMTLIFTGPWQD